MVFHILRKCERTATLTFNVAHVPENIIMCWKFLGIFCFRPRFRRKERGYMLQALATKIASCRWAQGNIEEMLLQWGCESLSFKYYVFKFLYVITQKTGINMSICVCPTCFQNLSFIVNSFPEIIENSAFLWIYIWFTIVNPIPFQSL